jgi:hypothetical protein
MQKYHYMTSDILLDYIEKNPAELNEASECAIRQIKELQAEKEDKETS